MARSASANRGIHKLNGFRDSLSVALLVAGRVRPIPAVVYSLKTNILVTAFAACLSAGINMYAQNPNQPPPMPDQTEQQSPGQPKTLVGCLTKGQTDHQYVLADQKTGEKVSFLASERIEPYLNQTVQLDGQEVTRNGEKAFAPQSVKKVSASCGK